MFGDQWVCLCGTRNFCLREKCRSCGRTEEEGKIKEESWMEIIASVIEINDHGEKERN